MKLIQALAAATVFGAGLLAAGCGSDSDDETGDGTADSVFVVMTATQSPEGDRFVFANALGSLTDEIDLGQAVELSGAGRVRTGLGKIFAFSNESLTVGRWGVGDDLALNLEDDGLSFANIGISGFGWSIAFASDTRAVNAADDARVFIVWNPTTMEIVDTIPWDDLLPAGASAGNPNVSPDGRYVYVPFLAGDFQTLEITPGAHLAIVDLETLTFEVLTDERCPGAQYGFFDPNTGDYYYEGDAAYGFFHYFATPQATAPCFLRVNAGESTFDPDFMRLASDVNSDGFSDIHGTHVIGDRFFTTVRDDSVVAVADLENPFDYFATHWQVYSGSTSDWVGSRVPGLEEQSLFTIPYVVDGQFLVAPVDIFNRGPDAAAPIYRVTEDGQWEYLTETSGSVMFVGRVR